MTRVTAAIIKKGGKVLIARRKPSISSAGLWEFPGGKIEPNETPERCLERELKEEFDIKARAGRLAATGRGVLKEGPFELLAFEVEHLSGEFRLHSHDEIRWVLPEDLAGYELPPADREIVAELLRSRS
ncbi:MAG: (deoxy)nucleoside triphosphate pyrophosphohydrolase [Candidatus Aminicenantes bacterium]|jgi:8-oxo-dGTP diphosphatase|nr:(deoxy)nucleoside triphosphate pyrophosphohydrolase [Candidatus Aminicenantes bacterium]